MKIKFNPLLFLVLILPVSCTTEKHTGRTEPISNPNILLILTSGLRADAMGYAGNSIIKTPFIDQLASGGTYFTNCYTMGYIQEPKGISGWEMLLTGRHLFNLNYNEIPKNFMPGYFESNNYVTFGTGNWKGSSEGFELNFQKGKNVAIGIVGDHFNVQCQDLNEVGKLTKPMAKGFSTDLFAEAAIDFLKDYALQSESKPFLCYLSFAAPHAPHIPREDYLGMYQEEKTPTPQNFNEIHPFAFDGIHSSEELFIPWPRTETEIKKSLSDYYAMISHMDKRIGDVIQVLEESGLVEKTIIVFVSINGLAIGSHGLVGKHNLYEHSIKVPLILKGPGIPSNQMIQSPVYLSDIFPTLTVMNNNAPPYDMDGSDLLPVIHGETGKPGDTIYSALNNTVRAVRHNDWKLIWYLRRSHVQLFNLREDPYEIRNLAGEKENKNKIVSLMNMLISWHKETGDTATLFPSTVLPMEYNFNELQHNSNDFQPATILDRK